MFAKFTYLCKRNLILQWRHKANLFLPALFLLLAGFFILYLGNNPPLLLNMQIGLILMMLAMLLPLGGLYQHDVDTGFLQIIQQSETPLLIYVYAKITAFIIAQQLALLPALLIYGLMAGVPLNMLGLYLLIAAIMLCGISFIGTMLSAPLQTAPSGLLALLLLPLLMPIAIFAASAVEHQFFGLNYQPHLLLLTGFSLLKAVLCPFITHKFLQIATARW
ncbi:MAG: heme exporter protein CcmB [Alphaproteobacteria bacterium]|nr:heme exporter protein CcmB [Alphaproteobacteria bacterium]